MATALTGYAAIKAGIIPVALVNQSFIDARDFTESVASIEHYYQEIARQAKEKNKENELSSLEIERATLDKLIENELIRVELEKRIVKEEIQSLVSKKIGALEEVKTPQFGGAVMALYGISADRFRELVLEPKAREEIFAESLEDEDNDFDSAIQSLRDRAKVRILVPGLHWEDAGVIVRGR